MPDTTSLPSEPTTDILILPGGLPGSKTFATNEDVQRLIRAYRDSGRWTAFICAATTALVSSVQGAGQEADLESSNKVRVTSHPSVRQQIVDAGWDYASDDHRVVVDGRVITSRGPGSAMLFALTIVEQLAGKAKRDEVGSPLVLSREL